MGSPSVSGHTEPDRSMNSTLNSGLDADGYPDPKMYNMSDHFEQLLFMQRYQNAQRHDPQANFAVVAFFLIMVRTWNALHSWKRFLMLPKRSSHSAQSVKVSLPLPHVLQITVMLAQSGLLLWKRKHKRSYELVRLQEISFDTLIHECFQQSHSFAESLRPLP